jgi:hypothetical protein
MPMNVGERYSDARWIHDGVRASLGELRTFFSTAYRFTRQACARRPTV